MIGVPANACYVLAHTVSFTDDEYAVATENIENIRKSQIIIKQEKIYFRPNEVHSLIGDYSKAKKILNWRPKINFDKLISEMVDEDLKLIK